MIARLSSLLCLLFASGVFAADVRFSLKGELPVNALAGLMEAWDLDDLQKQAGLPGNLNFHTIQDYLAEDTQLRELPENLQKEITASPFLPEGPMGDDSWVHIIRRWRALPLSEKIPVVRLSRFDPEDQARALLWFLQAGYPMPKERGSAPDNIKELVSQLTFETGKHVLRFKTKQEESDLAKAQQTAEALLRATRDEADLHWSVRTEDGPTADSAERYRLLLRLSTGEDPVRVVDKETVEFFWDESDALEGWLAVTKLPPAEAAAKVTADLRKALTPETLERWTLFVDDPRTSLADLYDWMAYLAPWPGRDLETRPLVMAVAKRIQNRLRPWKILQMGPETNVLALLDLIQLTSSLLAPEEKKITLAHGAFPLAVQYQMTPSPEILSQALARLATENLQARRAAVQRLEESDPAAVLPLIEALNPLPIADPVFTAALDKAKTKWNWEPARREIASDPPAAPSEPQQPSVCDVSLSSIIEGK